VWLAALQPAVIEEMPERLDPGFQDILVCGEIKFDSEKRMGIDVFEPAFAKVVE
jgi:hypothetical protein